MKERCIILNGGGTKNIVPVEKITLVSFKVNDNKTGYNAKFYIDNAITVSLDNLSEEDKDQIINIMQYKV